MRNAVPCACVVLLLLATGGAHGVEESVLERDAARTVRTWFDGAAERGHFLSPRDGVRLEYAVVSAREEKGALVVLPGESSTFLQYRELAYDLRESGFSLYLMDLRGQGLSERLVGDPKKSYVHDYRDWMADLDSFFRIVVSARPHGKVFLLGHSLGGAMAALFASENPGFLSGVTLASPRFRFPTSFPEPVAYALLRMEILFGRERDFAPGYGPDPIPRFEDNPLTTSPVRFAVLAADAAEAPGTAEVGATVRLLKEIRDLGTQALRRAGRIRTPVLLLEPEDDRIARRDMMEEARRKIRSCRAVVFPQARHGLLFERDAVRDEVLLELKAFLKAW
jgi:lysophospholipase